MHLFSPISLFTLIDFLGVFVAAVGGALYAERHEQFHYDFIGVFGLAFVSALGGGITRDIILQHGPPLAFVDVRYILTAFAGALLALLFGRKVGSTFDRLFIIIDAAAIGLFAVAGATRAIHAGLTFLPALILGVVTAVGGGSLRDVLSGRTPKVFERGQLYAIAAILAAVAFLLALRLAVSPSKSTAIGCLVGFAVRILAIRFGWRTRAVRDRSTTR